MRSLITLSILLIATTASSQTIHLNKKLQTFKQEAEKENGRKIVFVAEYSDPEGFRGSTSCGLPGEDITVHLVLTGNRGQDDSIVAHELGHAYLCKNQAGTIGWAPGIL